MLLIEVAEADTVARFGGDGFVVWLNELDKNKTKAKTQAGIVAEKIHLALSNPYVLEVTQEEKEETAIEHYCTASIGVVLFPYQEGGQEDIMKWDDTAMYQAKESGRNLIRFYDPKA